MSTNTIETASLPAILDDLGRELFDAHAIGLDVERATCHLTRRTTPSAEEVIALQKLDVLVQRLAALGAYVQALGLAAPNDVEVVTSHALGKVQLHDVRSRLAGRAEATSSEHETEFF